MCENFKALLTKKKLTRYQVSKATGVSQGTLSDWVNGKSIPKYENLKKIADHYGVTIEYLRDEEEKTPGPEGERRIALDDFTYAMYEEGKELTEENKKKLLEMAQFFRQQQEKEK